MTFPLTMHVDVRGRHRESTSSQAYSGLLWNQEYTEVKDEFTHTPIKVRSENTTEGINIVSGSHHKYSEINLYVWWQRTSSLLGHSDQGDTSLWSLQGVSGL